MIDNRVLWHMTREEISADLLLQPAVDLEYTDRVVLIPVWPGGVEGRADAPVVAEDGRLLGR